MSKFTFISTARTAWLRIRHRLEASRRASLIATTLPWVILFLGLMLALALAQCSTAHSYNVLVETEHLVLITDTADALRNPRWHLDKVSVEQPGNEGAIPRARFDGYVIPGRGVRITIQRVAEGPLTIQFEAEGSTSGNLYDTDGKRVDSLSDFVAFTWDDVKARAEAGDRLVLPLEGGVVLGQVGEEQSFSPAGSPILRSGRVLLLIQLPWWLGGDVSETKEAEIMPGEQIKFPGAGPLYGIITADERPAMVANLRAKSNTATIRRIGGTTRDVRATWVDVLRSSPFVQNIALIWGILFSLSHFFARTLKSNPSERISRSGVDPPQ